MDNEIQHASNLRASDLKAMRINEDNQVLADLLENVNAVLKDTDAVEEKHFIRDFMRKLSQFLRIAAIGSSGAGKSTLLNALFGGLPYIQDKAEPPVGICEYRYGEEENVFQLDAYSRRIFHNTAKLRGLSISDTQGVEAGKERAYAEKLREVVLQSDILFVVFSAQNIRDLAVWDLVEGTDANKLVFVITKCDLVSEEKQRECEKKAREYMEEMGLCAPIFSVSLNEKTQDFQENEGLKNLIAYVEHSIIGINPTLTKQQGNIKEFRQLLTKLSSSFYLRKKQYEADSRILERIDTLMDSFFANNATLVDSLKNDLSLAISKEIDAYQNEIIARLDAMQIWERFKNGGQEFMDYLTFIHDGYQQKMTKNVNEKTQAAVRTYLTGLEQVFDEATGYFRTREQMVSLEDKFYGSLAQSKTTMIKSASRNIQVTQEYYRTLTDAPSDLFMKVWKAREEYEKKLTYAQSIGSVGGIAAGGSAAYLLAGAAAMSGTTIVLWPLVGMALGGMLLSKMSKKIISARTMPELEERVKESVEEFRIEVAGTRQQMTEEILGTIEAIFKRELETTDKTFLDFRMSVNIEGRNIPLLEEKMEEINRYIEKIEELERKCRIE